MKRVGIFIINRHNTRDGLIKFGIKPTLRKPNVKTQKGSLSSNITTDMKHSETK